MARATIDVFGYLDYRSFLRDFYLEKKANGRGFSFRAFSKRAGLGSPNYLKLVMDGERNLTPEMAERFAEACGLTGEASTFFAELVGFNQARNAVERNEKYSKLTTYRRYRAANRIELAQAAYHSTWYMPAIRELAARKDFREDPEWIARTLVPPISPADAKQALEKLLELALLVRDESGRIAQGEPLITTGNETRTLHLRNYHRMMINRAADAIDTIPAPERDIASLTLCLGPTGLKRYKERLQRFALELLELSALESDPQQVVQINFQLFPLSKGREDGVTE